MRKLYEILKILQIKKKNVFRGIYSRKYGSWFFKDYLDTYTCIENTFAFSNFHESYQKH